MAKKKIDSYISKSVSIARVSLEDLRYLENLLKDEVTSESYRVHYRKYSYDSVDELKSEKPTHDEIELHTTTPYTSITLSKDGVRIFGGDSSVVTEGIVNTIYQYFVDKRGNTEKFGGWLGKVYPFIGGVLVPTPILLYLGGVLDKNYMALGTLAILVLNVLLFRWDTQRKTTIYFSELPPSFLARQKDQIILGVTFALLGGLAGAIITKVLSS